MSSESGGSEVERMLLEKFHVRSYKNDRPVRRRFRLRVRRAELKNDESQNVKVFPDVVAVVGETHLPPRVTTAPHPLLPPVAVTPLPLRATTAPPLHPFAVTPLPLRATTAPPPHPFAVTPLSPRATTAPPPRNFAVTPLPPRATTIPPRAAVTHLRRPPHRYHTSNTQLLSAIPYPSDAAGAVALPAVANARPAGDRLSTLEEPHPIVESKPMSESAATPPSPPPPALPAAPAMDAAAAVAAAAAAATNAAAAGVVAGEPEEEDHLVLPAKEPVRGGTPRPLHRTHPAAPVEVEPIPVIVSVNESAAPGPPDIYKNPVDSQLCAMNPCKNEGICKIQPFGSSKIFCRCLPGFFGSYCQYDAQECQQDPCLHNGGCRRSLLQPRGYECRCTDGYGGDNCEIEMATSVKSLLTFGLTESALATTLEPPDWDWTKVNRPFANRTLFAQVSFLTMLSLAVLMLVLSLVSSINVQRKIALERYTVLRAHGYDVDYPSSGYCVLAVWKCLFITCICCSICPCCDALFMKVAEEQVPLSVLLKTAKIKGNTRPPQSGTGASCPSSPTGPAGR